ncbi:RE2 [Symbiodinium sp. KB8]|nr:RE2 [Symbiodinium sp. KB8]
MQVNVSRVLDSLAEQHYEIREHLQGLVEQEEEPSVGADQLYWTALKGLELQSRNLRDLEGGLLRSAHPVVLKSLSVAEDLGTGESEGAETAAEEEPVAVDVSDPPPLQTKIIAADQVRREPEKWIPSMTDEYQSLVSKTGAVEELSEGEYRALAEDPCITLEIIPGKLVYVHKTSGRRKSRIVGCGNFCRGENSERNELYASGAGAESLRLMIRRCALQPEWVLTSVDVRTAFLQAPLLEKQREGKRLVTIVRVPSILRETGVTACRFWKVRKALYGLASAPKSWSNHRDKVLAGIRVPCEGGVLQLSKMLEDANLLHIMMVPKEAGGEAVIKALQDQWELSSPEWLAEPGDQMKFAGYELQKTPEGVRLHQESYVQDLLEQNEELVEGEERTPAIKMGTIEEPDNDAERRELTKRSQGLIGQLLWLAGRTRPDLAYAVSMAAQKIASNPREAAARAEHVVKYLRSAPAVSLHYKVAGDSWGKWNHLRHKQTSTTVEVYTDASFAADEQCRSFGSVQLYWGGALVSWAAGRQSLIAAHTAESELYSLSEGHLMGKAFRPTVAALMNVSERDVICHLYCDNSAAVQLCTLESGSWRTRHLRLRGAVIRQDLENDAWSLAHLDGVYMPADLGTKPVGPARLEDLVKVCDLWAPHLEQSSDPPRPSVAAVRLIESSMVMTKGGLRVTMKMSLQLVNGPQTQVCQEGVAVAAGVLQGHVGAVGVLR